MKITLKSLQLTNFKGTKERFVPLDDHTTISGANRTGKTTLFDAFNWLLFGKDSTDKKDFSIKPFSHDHKTTDKLDNEVIGVLDIDGSIQTFRRVNREKWVKPRGEAVPVFQGNETLFFINYVPVQAGDYNKAISELISDHLFKLLTSPTYFASLPWQTKREMVFKLAGNITDNHIAMGNPEFEQLLSRGKDLVMLKKELASKKALLKKSLDEIPHRIDEVLKGKPEPVDTKQVTDQIAGLEKLISDIETKIADKIAEHQTVLDAEKEVMTKIADLQNQKNSIATAERQKLFDLSTKQTAGINELKGQISSVESDIKSRNSSIELLRKDHTSKSNELQAKRDEAAKIQNSTPVFDSVELCCPTCKRDLPATDVESKKKELTENFNRDKIAKMKHINDVGLTLKAEVERIGKLIEQEQKTIELLTEKHKVFSKKLAELQAPGTEKIPSLDQVLSTHAEYIEITNKIIELEARPKPEPASNDELVTEKKTYQAQIDDLKKSLQVSEQIEKANARIAELERETSSLSQQIADLEKTEFCIERFTKTKIEAVESKINSLFSKVTFKMYEKQINGGESETCEILVNGVPFPDVNHADQINAGIDIINTFSKHSGVTAPIFVDNAEAVNELLPTDSQVIELVVTTDPQLTIQNRSKVCEAV